MVRYNELYEMALENRGRWIDEIRLVGAGQDVLRLILFYRFKTSGMSGNEWRISCGWQVHTTIVELIQGDCEPFPRDANWWNFDTGYGGQMETGCAALFPGLFDSQPALHDLSIAHVDFYRKRRLLYRSSHDGKALPLLALAGHLPWALVMACDEPLGTDASWDDMRRLCFQDGCAEKAVSVYGLKHTYNRHGDQTSDGMCPSYLLGRGEAARRYVRAFCPLHLIRGDSDFDDSDSNYDVLWGPGPEKAMGWEEYESKSVVV